MIHGPSHSLSIFFCKLFFFHSCSHISFLQFVIYFCNAAAGTPAGYHFSSTCLPTGPCYGLLSWLQSALLMSSALFCCSQTLPFLGILSYHNHFPPKFPLTFTRVTNMSLYVDFVFNKLKVV